jgi:tRNA U34 5-carboxymethylaminomethyl modifying enzyme MnmG/GidA
MTSPITPNPYRSRTPRSAYRWALLHGRWRLSLAPGSQALGLIDPSATSDFPSDFLPINDAFRPTRAPETSPPENFPQGSWREPISGWMPSGA